MNEFIRMGMDVLNGASLVYDAVEFLQPTLDQLPGGIEVPQWAAPSLAIGALLSLAALSGVAVSSMAVTLTALLLVAMILDQIFGVSLELS